MKTSFKLLLSLAALATASPAPAQTVQLSQPGIWSISLFTVAPGGAGVGVGEGDGVGVGEAEGVGVGVGEGDGVGVGVGEGEVPTIKPIEFLKTAPVESQA